MKKELRNVFIIDQNKTICQAVEMVLKNHGLKTYSLTTTDDCFYQIEAFRPDVILLDWATIQKEQAQTLTDNLKHHHDLCSVPIIYLVNQRQGQGEEQGHEETLPLHDKNSLTFILTKPLEIYFLKDQLEDLLEDLFSR